MIKPEDSIAILNSTGKWKTPDALDKTTYSPLDGLKMTMIHKYYNQDSIPDSWSKNFPSKKKHIDTVTAKM